ncbi:hypothetical protein H5410_005891 [Solanum commersonii]|uniref:SWIM-type domain-containing protein n=1 Tax=Solanum commersonii TaxID=4109 RepID=A0A9J6A839_SOLCO|nr:hypothetical protein H5410_005891 [Solanum commersonii]
MNGFTLITLRWYHGGVLDLSSGEPIYNGGTVTEFLDVDIDKMSYFELKDYIRELGYSTTCTFSIKAPNSGILGDVDNDKDILGMMCSLEDGDEVEVFVRHLVDEAIVGPMLIENGSHVDMGEFGSTFNTRPSGNENFNFGVGEDHLNSEDPVVTFSTSPPFTTTPLFNTATADSATADGATDDDIDVGPAGPDFSKEEVEGSDYSTEDSVESEAELVRDDDEEEYGSDVHEEVRELRAEKRSEVGPDLGFDETETGKVSHEGSLGGDEPYFASFDENSFKLDEDECCNDDEHESGRSRRGMSVAITNVLPKCEHKMYARHILANWDKDWRGFQRRQQFWKIDKSTFESQLRNNIEKMKLLGPEKMMDKLMYYNINFWCKVYFNTEVKCDSVDNNMSECFNAWILAARHKTIITILEEIRVKMMTRIAKLREFPITWKCNFSPIALKVLEENISRSMDCTIEFNGVVGFEVKEGICQHKVDIARKTCSCRVWQLRGIPCAHVRIYANVIEPLTNMEMWPVSTLLSHQKSQTCLVGHLRLEGKKLEKLRNLGSFLGLDLQ